MTRVYLSRLDSDSLDLLAETTGLAPREHGSSFFADRPYDITVALRSPEARNLLGAETDDSPVATRATTGHRRLQIAIAINRCAEEICAAGLSAQDSSPIDIDLIRFSAAGATHEFMIDLLASYLVAPADSSVRVNPCAPSGPASEGALGDLRLPRSAPGSLYRLHGLLDLCEQVEVTERGGVLRLLADEALFTLAIAPDRAVHEPIDQATLVRLQAVLPRAVGSLLGELAPEIPSLLRLYLVLGPIWYRMASLNLLHRPMRGPLGDMARDFSLARRFLVRVSQGPLAPLRDELFFDAH